MTRHPVNKAIRTAEAAMFDLYALPPRRGRIRGWLANALAHLTAAVAFVGFGWAVFFLAFAFGG